MDLRDVGTQPDQWLAARGRVMDEESQTFSKSVHPKAGVDTRGHDLAYVGLFPLGVLLMGMIIRTTFQWYLAALGLPVPSLVQASGIALTVRFFLLLMVEMLVPRGGKSLTTEDLLTQNAGLPALFLGLSWLLHFLG